MPLFIYLFKTLGEKNFPPATAEISNIMNTLWSKNITLFNPVFLNQTRTVDQ